MAVDPLTAVGIGASIGGAIGSTRSASRNARATRRMQMQMFREGMDQTIQRRVTDARKAGISPLAAIGAPGASMMNISPPGNTSSVAAGLTAAGRGLQALAARQANENIAKTQAETSAVKTQIALARLELARRQFNLHKAAQAEASKPPNLYTDYVINKEPNAPGTVRLLSEGAAESGEGLLGGTTAVGQNIVDLSREALENLVIELTRRGKVTPRPGDRKRTRIEINRDSSHYR